MVLHDVHRPAPMTPEERHYQNELLRYGTEFWETSNGFMHPFSLRPLKSGRKSVIAQFQIKDVTPAGQWVRAWVERRRGKLDEPRTLVVDKVREIKPGESNPDGLLYVPIEGSLIAQVTAYPDGNMEVGPNYVGFSRSQRLGIMHEAVQTLEQIVEAEHERIRAGLRPAAAAPADRFPDFTDV